MSVDDCILSWRCGTACLELTARRSCHLTRCRHCGCSLLRIDFLGLPVCRLDEALAWHERGQCNEYSAEYTLHATRCRGLTDLDDAPIMWPEFEPPLVYAARAGRVEDALAILRYRWHPIVLRCASGGLDLVGKGSATALHHAAARNSAELVNHLLSAGASPMQTTQDDIHHGLAGGRTPLHAAANAAAASAAAVLLDAAPAAAAAADWDGRLPFELAWLAGAHELATRLSAAAEATLREAHLLRLLGHHTGGASGAASDEDELLELLERVREVEARPATASDQQHARTMRKVELRERRRDALHVSHREPLHTAHVLRGAWAEDDCRGLLAEAKEAASRHGWSTGTLPAPTPTLHPARAVCLFPSRPSRPPRLLSPPPAPASLDRPAPAPRDDGPAALALAGRAPVGAPLSGRRDPPCHVPRLRHPGGGAGAPRSLRRLL